MIRMLPGAVKKLVSRKESRSTLGETKFSVTKELQYEYSRPSILGTLSPHAVELISSNSTRVVICPTKPSSLPGSAGYAEVVNAGKSKTSEDQSVAIEHTLDDKYKYTLFAVYDGHGGNGTSLKLAHELHVVIYQALQDILPEIEDAIVREKHPEPEEKDDYEDFEELNARPFTPSLEELISGTLESCFWVMDSIILHDKGSYKITGGSTALMAFFMFDRTWIVNSGDSRAVLYRKDNDFLAEPLSFDFTPESDRRRIQEIAFHKPHLLKQAKTGEQIFSRLQFSRKLTKDDIGKQVLYRDFYMSGWGLKVIINIIIIIFIIIITRSLGDYELIHRSSLCNMKEFLTPQPEVRLWKPTQEMSKEDVIVIATDGMWDVVTNKEAGDIVRQQATQGEIVYTNLAKRLVERARGERKDGFWEKEDGNLASGDDISVFVIPIHKFMSFKK
ncbi:protein phosphatase 1H [Eurytemora carolleeae]|uniref:protein phosphatase 1H n=1 Tax=Eurytemora carolleeae TaxID=1294199 RepID=UPI000C75D2EC|nr:protein phosphatase 1H [Eurytemora carolleeae]|eukprot:XP_023340110.1 protein phosphatase 1H-like [Eurytemora affinis]